MQQSSTILSLPTARYTDGNVDDGPPADDPATGRASDGRYRAIFEAAGFAIWEADCSGAYAAAQTALAAGVTDIRAWFEARPELLRQLAASAPITDANPAAVRLFGAASREALLRDGIAEYRTAVTLSSLPGNIAAILGGASVVETETQFRTAAGDTIDVILRMTMPPDHDGWRRTLMMAIDVTAWHRDQARLRQAEAELAHALRITTLGQLASAIAHDVNQPLSAIATYAESGKRWLAREASDASEVADCIAHIAVNARRAAQIIERIRSLAQNRRPSVEAVDVAAVLEESVELIRHELDGHEVRFRSSLPRALPAVLGDRIQLQQVIVNLALNAVHAMSCVPPSERQLTVELCCERDTIRMAFDDTGPGFEDGDPTRFFQSFVTTKSDGMGMGLSICQTIVGHHGGAIALEAKAGRGARVVVTLPAKGRQVRSAA